MDVMNPTERRSLIEKYREGPDAVDGAFEGTSDNELDRRPAPGEWTAREVAHHLADSETTSAIRLRRLLAEDNPELPGYDENEFARRLHYDRPIASSLEVLRAVRANTAELLDLLTEADWAREGTHVESGRYTVETWLETYAAHAHDHADQIRQALGR
jgi:hypothetical protein